MKMTYLEVGQEIDKILNKKNGRRISDQIQGILDILAQVNKTNFEKPRKTPSIRHTLHRAWGLEKSGVGAEIVRYFLKEAKMLLIFEAMQVRLTESDTPKITAEDINQIKETDWPEKSPKMVKLIKNLKKIKKGNLDVYKTDPEIKIDTRKGRHDVKTVSKETTPILAARECMGDICVAAKLVVTVKFLKIIATDYLKGYGIETPKDRSKRDKKFDMNNLDHDKDNCIHQLLYNLSIMVDELVDIIIVRRKIVEAITKIPNTKRQFDLIIKNYNEKAKVPAGKSNYINQYNYHIIATFLHVLERLKDAIDNDKGVKSKIEKYWNAFLVNILDTKNEYSRSNKDKCSMLTVIKHYKEKFDRSESKKQAKLTSGEGRKGKKDDEENDINGFLESNDGFKAF